MSATIDSAPAASITDARSALRASARTRCPDSASRSTVPLPSTPVAPVTKTVVIAIPLPSLGRHRRGDGLQPTNSLGQRLRRGLGDDADEKVGDRRGAQLV